MSAFQIRHHHNLAPRAKSVERKVRSQPLKKKSKKKSKYITLCRAWSALAAPKKKRAKKKSKIYHSMSTAKCASSPWKKWAKKKRAKCITRCRPLTALAAQWVSMCVREREHARYIGLERNGCKHRKRTLRDPPCRFDVCMHIWRSHTPLHHARGCRLARTHTDDPHTHTHTHTPKQSGGEQARRRQFPRRTACPSRGGTTSLSTPLPVGFRV